MRRRRGSFLRAIGSDFVDYLYSFRHWYRWKVRQRPHAGLPEAAGFFLLIALIALLVLSYM